MMSRAVTLVYIDDSRHWGNKNTFTPAVGL